MNSEKFESLVFKAVESLPEEFLDRMENIDVFVADRPTREQLATLGHDRYYTLLGLYEGVPLTERSHGYGMVVPDRITVFQKPIEAICKNDSQIVAEVRRVVLHEIAHHFGIDDARLKELGM